LLIFGIFTAFSFVLLDGDGNDVIEKGNNFLGAFVDFPGDFLFVWMSARLSRG
jgi:hypothetical protein